MRRRDCRRDRRRCQAERVVPELFRDELLHPEVVLVVTRRPGEHGSTTASDGTRRELVMPRRFQGHSQETADGKGVMERKVRVDEGRR